MENKPKKSKAIIITIIALILLLILGYFLFKKSGNFGVKTSTDIAKIFSPLTTSNNQETTIAQAGEDISKGDSVSVSGTGSNNTPIVVKTTNGNVFGIANQNITNGNTGEIMTKKVPNSFFNSFSNFLGGIFSKNQSGTLTPTNPSNSCTNGATNPPACTNNGNQCTNGADNFPQCTTTGGKCMNNASNPPLCNIIGDQCSNGADNPNLCTTINNKCINGSTNPPLCNSDGSQCTNGADNFPQCTTIGGQCVNFATNPPLCTTTPDYFCVNGAINPPACTVLPGGLCFNGADNPTDCTTINGQCINFATNPPKCTVIGGACFNGAENPPDCSTIGGKCINGANNPTACSTFDAEMPDLTANIISPTSTTINTPTTLSSVITNSGGSSTMHSFSSYFSIIKSADNNTNQTPAEPVELTTMVPTLESRIGNVAQVSYTFTTATSYQIRACADKNSSTDEGTVAESNENNNCGPWTTFTVSDSLPTDGDICSNGADNPTICTTKDGQCLNGADNPPDCTNVACANGATNPPDCTDIPAAPAANKCLLIDQNPLTFTDAEKAQLAELLRKFYLISPTLKTIDDISLVYSDILQQSNFSDQLTSLIKECYKETSEPSYINGGGPTLQYGNPWFKYDRRGSYLDSSYDNAPSYCTKAPGPWPHKSFNCPGFKDKLSCEQYNFTPILGSRQTLNTGCTWVENLNLKDYETILNIW